jgi:nitrate/nitrite transporter NarK
MVDAMRRVTFCIVVALACLGAATGPARAAASSPAATTPSPAAIRRAVTHAERSSYLWATINICRTQGRQGGLLGVRGEMGALGFGTTLAMTVQLRQYDSSHRIFSALKATTARRTVTLGWLRSGVHQDGAEFHFSSQTGLLDATVTFSWTRGGHRLGEVTRSTTDAHHTAAFAEPAGHSVASCRL